MTFSNISRLDRYLRIMVGLLMLAIGWRADVGAAALPLRVFGLYPLITGLSGWCPIYTLLRIRSRR